MKILDNIVVAFIIFGVGLQIIYTFDKWYIRIILVAILFIICRLLIDCTKEEVKWKKE